jgi:hypothetical protein
MTRLWRSFRTLLAAASNSPALGIEAVAAFKVPVPVADIAPCASLLSNTVSIVMSTCSCCKRGEFAAFLDFLAKVVPDHVRSLDEVRIETQFRNGAWPGNIDPMHGLDGRR